MEVHLPSQFQYLQRIAAPLHSLGFEHEVDQYLDSLTESQINELRLAYEAIRGRGDGAALSGWINLPKRSRDEQVACNCVFMLLVLFDGLGKRGLHPFSDEAVRYDRTYPPRKWNLLPDEFEFLAPAAERYGVALGEQGFNHVAESLTSDDVAELTRIAEELKRRDLVESVQSWAASFECDGDGSAFYTTAAVMNLFELLDGVDLI